MGDAPACDLCGAPDPSEDGAGWLAVMLVFEDIPHPCGFALCAKCKSTPVAKLEEIARMRWAEYLHGADKGWVN